MSEPLPVESAFIASGKVSHINNTGEGDCLLYVWLVFARQMSLDEALASQRLNDLLITSAKDIHSGDAFLPGDTADEMPIDFQDEGALVADLAQPL
jgi:hypothetical protein